MLNPAKACSNMFALDSERLMINCLSSLKTTTSDGIGANVIVNVTDLYNPTAEYFVNGINYR